MTHRLEQSKGDKETVETELNAVMQVLKQLREMCMDRAMTYEERTAKRKQEIAGLKEALEILEQEAPAALLQKKSFLQREY